MPYRAKPDPVAAEGVGEHGVGPGVEVEGVDLGDDLRVRQVPQGRIIGSIPRPRAIKRVTHRGVEDLRERPGRIEERGTSARGLNHGRGLVPVLGADADEEYRLLLVGQGRAALRGGAFQDLVHPAGSSAASFACLLWRRRSDRRRRQRLMALSRYGRTFAALPSRLV